MDADRLIEDHALLADRRAAALVTREGRIDWLCMPRYDSPAALCALLGDDSNGHWTLGIRGGTVTSRRYLEGTMILETRWEGPEGTAQVIDMMPSDITAEEAAEDPSADERSDLVRLVKCTAGSVEVEQQLRIRFEYGAVVPWMRRVEGPHGEPVLSAIAGGSALAVRGPGLDASDHVHRGRHTLRAGEEQAWTMTWHESWTSVPRAVDPGLAIARTAATWREWLGDVAVDPRYREQVTRSLLVLHGLSDVIAGGVVAAPTTSLPEDFGGERNWDYRYCWLRDAALSLEALLTHGHVEAAIGWRDWLLRAMAGDPEHLQIMYGISGERWLPESELSHLRGYEDSRPVRVGNGAVTQYQGDVIGEVMLAFAAMREAGLEETTWSWSLQRTLLDFAASHLRTKDQGLWEMRGEPGYFTHSRVMTWAAFDCGIDAVERAGLHAKPEFVATWRQVRDELREEILREGVGPDGAFTQTYGSGEVDASLLQISRTGFVPPEDPRMLATVRRIEQELMTEGGLVLRYRTQGQDGLSGSEHPFLACCFWLVEYYASAGRPEDARTLLERVLACGNDLMLFSEEYDDAQGRMAGNFPQAFSHLALVRAVDSLCLAEGDPGSR
ncbi:glycoside hydrolase family 15 [Brachybacterium endophyticum]|uniref:Glycoside hydrolase family 15 n=1 Tax=Brachybacterium endophyticum TaxID=2182385 RepID=A0A2U2RNA1_9MICO|nr:glycoside hydrolase family 15 protein [Brachybacterium endophyticum]PWH07357.1 glycoside hydrolase family 15 [Brachybacterium endophyticum]